MNKEALRKLFDREIFYFIEDDGENQTSETGTIPPVSREDYEENLTIKGSGKSGIAVIVHYEGEISPVDYELLKKILASVNINFEEVSLVNIHAFEKVDIIYGAKNIVFGQKCHDFLLPESPFYEPCNHGDGLFLFVDSLELLQNDKDLKMKLWKCLKSIFID